MCSYRRRFRRLFSLKIVPNSRFLIDKSSFLDGKLVARTLTSVCKSDMSGLRKCLMVAVDAHQNVKNKLFEDDNRLLHFHQSSSHNCNSSLRYS